MFAPYQVQTWADIPDALKEPTGLFVGDYGGYMSVGYDSSKFAAPTSLDDLLTPAYKGAVAINGDPTQAGAAFAAVGLATVQSGGTLDDYQPGIDFFGSLQKAGNLLKVDVTTATVASGETSVVFDWDYLNTAHQKGQPGVQGRRSRWHWLRRLLQPGDQHERSPHLAAARLWQEFLYSDEVQNLWLKGGAPTCAHGAYDRRARSTRRLRLPSPRRSPRRFPPRSSPPRRARSSVRKATTVQRLVLICGVDAEASTPHSPLRHPPALRGRGGRSRGRGLGSRRLRRTCCFFALPTVPAVGSGFFQDKERRVHGGVNVAALGDPLVLPARLTSAGLRRDRLLVGALSRARSVYMPPFPGTNP
ncbi:MAG: ABC transporter substrate-binding protein [Microbacterium sp.]